MDVITDEQRTQGIAPGNNWLVVARKSPASFLTDHQALRNQWT